MLCCWGFVPQSNNKKDRFIEDFFLSGFAGQTFSELNLSMISSVSLKNSVDSNRKNILHYIFQKCDGNQILNHLNSLDKTVLTYLYQKRDCFGKKPIDYYYLYPAEPYYVKEHVNVKQHDTNEQSIILEYDWIKFIQIEDASIKLLEYLEDNGLEDAKGVELMINQFILNQCQTLSRVQRMKYGFYSVVKVQETCNKS